MAPMVVAANSRWLVNSRISLALVFFIPHGYQAQISLTGRSSRNRVKPNDLILEHVATLG
jgi:hypothetical protein